MSRSEADEVLAHVQRMAEDGEVRPSIWIEQGWLDAAQLSDIRSELEDDDGADFGEETSRVMRADELEAFVRADTAYLYPKRPGRGDVPDAFESLTEVEEDSFAETMEFSTGDESSNAFDSQMKTLVRAASEVSVGADESSDILDGLSGGDGDEGPAEDFGPAGTRREPAELAFAETSARDEGADDQPSPDRGEVANDPLDPGERFVFGRALGQGGGGLVLRAYDRVLGRTVAMKILRPEGQEDEKTLSRFIFEGQATGQLEHPNIVPVYDFGMLPSGEVYYTMREVRRNSLREVINAYRSGDPETVEEFTLVRLLTMLRQVCQAVHYAHSRGIVHRDLKPDNVMVGENGEVVLMDWGLARVLDDQMQTDLSGSVEDDYWEEGETFGTPAYMPPEQARGELAEVDERSDIYSLGAILYEILTLQPPYVGKSPEEVMRMVVEGELVAPSERAPQGRAVPEELERLCLEATAYEKSDRVESAKLLQDRLEDWIEGIQPREAQARIDAGKQAAREYDELREESRAYEAKVRELAADVEQWEPIPRKRELWTLEDKRDEMETAAIRAFGEAVSSFTQALAYQPDNEAAAECLADLYFKRFETAEKRGDEFDAIHYRALVEQYDTGKYEQRLQGVGRLEIQAQPTDADATLFRFQEIDRRMVAADEVDMDGLPASLDAVEVGSYLLTLEHPDTVSARVPIEVRRAETEALDVDLPGSDRAEEGFLFINGGAYLCGGDPEAFDPRDPERVHVGPFFCAELPVTFREYLVYFNELYERIGDEALPRAPQTRDSDGMLIRYDEDQALWVPDEILIEGSARDMYPIGEGHEYDIPVVGVRPEDADAYCEWLSDREGVDYRLPTEDELEKAGRGVDGRFFPWGNRFDATFCKMRFSRSENPQLEPVGAFVDDVSPYGVRDLGGGVQEWCQPEPGNDVERPCRGGAWNQDMRASRLASRISLLAEARSAGVGFRLVYSA
jgi:serine/threonine-protein kinase